VVLVVTDGEPTAHLEADGYAAFDWPPSPQTLAATVGEVDRRRAEEVGRQPQLGELLREAEVHRDDGERDDSRRHHAHGQGECDPAFQLRVHAVSFA